MFKCKYSSSFVVIKKTLFFLLYSFHYTKIFVSRHANDFCIFSLLLNFYVVWILVLLVSSWVRIICHASFVYRSLFFDIFELHNFELSVLILSFPLFIPSLFISTLWYILSLTSHNMTHLLNIVILQIDSSIVFPMTMHIYFFHVYFKSSL